jgi:formylglycine-generating enzyme required for sulfatase activity
VSGRADHPVVHVAYEDVLAFAKWIDKRVPTEAEFEFAARGGLDRHKYPWGNDMNPGGKAAANIWQGRFPARDRGEDGYLGTSPVTAFPVNGFGLYDMGGNVWQWCSDWYRPDTYAPRAQPGTVTQDPQGPSASFDPAEPGAAKRVLRGGSYLCTDQYCARYLVGSRGKSEVTSGTSNLGFRLVRSAPR